MASQDEEEGPAAQCAGGLVAGTIALMTKWAAAEGSSASGEGDAGSRRLQTARRIVHNLYLLREHPHLTAPMRQLLGQAHAQWVPLALGQEEGEGPSIAQLGTLPTSASLH